MKKRLLVIVVLLAALWPFGHFVLVNRFDLNPWRFSGWAMYTTPVPPVVILLLEERDGGLTAMNQQAMAAPVKETIVRFLVERHALGKLRRPDDVARALFGARRKLQRLVIVVRKMALDRRTARMASTRNRYVYDRPRSLPRRMPD